MLDKFPRGELFEATIILWKIVPIFLFLRTDSAALQLTATALPMTLDSFQLNWCHPQFFGGKSLYEVDLKQVSMLLSPSTRFERQPYIRAGLPDEIFFKPKNNYLG
jgi:hypothetical protein